MNKHRIEDDIVIISLTQGQETIIDLADWDLVKDYRWYAHWEDNTFYVLTNVYSAYTVQQKIRLHRLLLAAPKGVLVDHVDRNGLNNRRNNIRLVTSLENRCHSVGQKGSRSAYKGVTWNKQSRKWQSGIMLHGQSRHLGLFNDELDAAEAYDEAAIELFGEYALLNFPNSIRGEINALYTK